MSTLFTKIINGEIPGRFVWADETCVAFATIEPHTDGHVMVVPRQEIDSYVDAPDELVAHLAIVARRIGAVQTRVFDAPRAGIVVAGYGVNHLHVHVLPIRNEEDLSFSSARRDLPPELIDSAMETLRAGLREDGWSAFVPRSIAAP
ncbi:MAG: HIT family protein [Actinomyces sp.]|uniref:HIT family protein n=1 Tax=Actinomyces sp. TaxID=29317 RepID=UPI0026DA7652|nr:HIT family protein [Actinomyces sp.]MDO4242621.1 HIT family protein [Actinomyces sp.]